MAQSQYWQLVVVLPLRHQTGDRWYNQSDPQIVCSDQILVGSLLAGEKIKETRQFSQWAHPGPFVHNVQQASKDKMSITLIQVK